MDDPNNLIFIMLLVFLVPVGIVAALSLWALRPWMRATMAGTQLTIFEVIGMKLRGADVDAVVAALFLAQQCEVEVHQVDLQRASLAGIDVEKLTLAWITVQRREMPISFDELITMHRGGQTEELVEAGIAEIRAIVPPSEPGDE